MNPNRYGPTTAKTFVRQLQVSGLLFGWSLLSFLNNLFEGDWIWAIAWGVLAVVFFFYARRDYKDSVKMLKDSYFEEIQATRVAHGEDL
jgi:hypothetical protein